MATQKRKGFTIVELMLFLAITGALTVGILVGSSVAIGQQRYRDSVNSFKGLIQEQYSQISNVINGEQENLQCVQSEEGLDFPDDTLQARGTSDCLVIGRFILINDDTVSTYNILGKPLDELDGGSNSGATDAEILGGYSVALQSPEDYKISWSARIVEPKTETASLTSIAIVRSPISGSILTYVLDGDHSFDIVSMFDDANMAQKEFCVDSGGMSAMANRLAVRINSRAASQSAIEIPLESEGICEV